MGEKKVWKQKFLQEMFSGLISISLIASVPLAALKQW